ncbi:MAG TPA: hypothetical protein HPP57_05630 [Deltaproteobacteria bacterium]|jgi:hypothetical protein|nr:hypothetical protein [Deltaproteobacteria bacterium]
MTRLKMQGVEQHRRFNRMAGAGVRTEGDLRSWMQESFPALNASLWENCRKQADAFLETGVKVYRWENFPPFVKRGREDFENSPPESPKDLAAGFSPITACRVAIESKGIILSCPAVLFGKGGLSSDPPLLAVFNSRKPRLISPDSDWLRALRFFFLSLDPREIALAGSTGTLTYDLAGAHALRSGLRQLLVAPFPLMKADRELLKIYGENAGTIPVFSCMLDNLTCSKKQAPICRDRILGALANFHLVLEIRSRGNLLAALEEIQAKSPRPQFVFEPEETNSSNAGNRTLLTKFSGHAHGFKLPVTQDLPAAKPVPTQCPANENSPRSSKGRPLGFYHSSHHGDIAWSNYLFHYTRACAGPWPGRSYHQYLVDLLDGHPLSGHSALETLIRIIQEGHIRACSRMVRGQAAVISWSSHPPQELFVMRKWNRALVRWTVEPYGVAVRRDILRSLGAKPAIYGSEKVYPRLVESERYRFQLSRSASWRHEREWRFRGNLTLGKIKSDKGFVFVQTKEEKAKLCSLVNPGLPIVVLNA